jgi:hypothetical protein
VTRMIRKQVFITADQNKRLKAQAAARGMSEAELVRAGIDLQLERKPEKTDWRRLVDSFSGSWAERHDLDEEMLAIRRSWNRRDQLLGRKSRRAK